MDENQSLKVILELRSMIEKVYFKEFETSFAFPTKLNQSHINTMMILRFESEGSMSMISDKLNMEKGSFTPVADKLIQLGFIEKIPDHKDKRVFNLFLTDSGRDFTSEFCEGHNAYMKKILECLSENEKELYFAAIQLVNNITKKVQSNKNDE